MSTGAIILTVTTVFLFSLLCLAVWWFFKDDPEL